VHNTPYVSWHETSGTTTSTFVGHFEGNPTNPVFHIDTGAIPTTTPAASDDDVTDVRPPVASTCPDDPFTGDGSTCPGGAVGTPFFAYTNNANGGPRALFAQAYLPGTVATGAASGITQRTATVAAGVNTDGASALVHFDYGTSTAYGSTTPEQLLAPAAGTSTSVSAPLASLPAGTLIHYRVVAQTDFGTVDGPDATFKTLTVGKPTVTHASLRGVARRKAKLTFTIKAGTNAPAIKTIQISLPNGLGFSHSSKKLKKGIKVNGAGGRHLKFRAKLSNGTLRITLQTAATEIHVSIGAPAITVSGHLARQVKHRKVKKLVVVLKVTDVSGKTTRLRLKLRVS
jgi:hypothetical protein